jgi:hypothetical protein
VTRGDTGPPLGNVGNQAKVTFNMPIGVGPSSSLQILSGFNCVLFFAADLPPAGPSDSEIGFPTCSQSGFYLQMSEPDPTGPAGRSGYTRYWVMNLPADAQLAGQSRAFNILFSRVNQPGAVVTFPDGSAVPDLTGPRASTLNIP